MEVEQVDSATPVVAGKSYTLVNQKVDLDISFDQRITGTSHLTIFPERPDLQAIILNARQCEITNITINDHKPLKVFYSDPCDTLSLHTNADVHQHHILREGLSAPLHSPPDPELVILLPPEVKIEATQEVVTQTPAGVQTSKLSGNVQNETDAVDGLTDTAVSKYTKLEVKISFNSIHTRDAIQFACGPPGSGKWPHAYTRGSYMPGRASCLFPCMDSLYYRCAWEISITGPRTVGDALRQMLKEPPMDEKTRGEAQAYEAKEMVFVCPGEISDDYVNKHDSSRRTVSYTISQNVSAQHIGFAVGPFEQVDLGALRDAHTIEMLQENAASITAFCLPGRKAEVENTCLPTTEALDHFVGNYAPYPFFSFSYCFVDDQADQTSSFAGLTLCSSRMLYPEAVIDPAHEVTRTLIQALTCQWLGIQIIPSRPEDSWVVIGSAMFIAELFMKELCGNNEHRFRMKTLADRICELDRERPSLWDAGQWLHVDPFEYEFIAMKALLVLYILDRRIAKESGSGKMGTTIGRFLSKARNDELKDNLMSTQEFDQAVYRVLHKHIDDFLNQWVKGAGCPSFYVQQKFNKKKLVIEMEIKQIQAQHNTTPRELDSDMFMRDVREHYGDVWATEPQHVFTGPMTVRIHEADGTPYEHIIHIKEAVQKFEVPYNTKYKRVKRGKKQRAKDATRVEGDDEQDTLLYCLGDTLQEDKEVEEWRISEWSAEDETRMNNGSYEWVRVDADFEWIAHINLQMLGPMYVSQLQQDKDVAAQLFTIQAIGRYTASALISSILLRTVYDQRYFHGIRTTAAEVLVKHASKEKDADMIGLFHLKKLYEEFYCTTEGGSMMAKPNNFADTQQYLLQCKIIESISKVRDELGYTPDEVNKFLLEKLRFNDNSQNDYSDAYYVATLLKGLTDAIIARPPRPAEVDLEEMPLDEQEVWANKAHFERTCLDEIDRYRRMDEWASSYQNLYSRTALECQARLMKAGIGQFSNMHFLQYARPGNYDLLRCAAYDILAAMDIFTTDRLLQNFVHGMVAATSPYVRVRMRRAFGIVLASKALGYESVRMAAAVVDSGEDLMVEGAPVASAAPDEGRRTSVEGALKALKVELGEHNVLQQALWDALNHPEAGYEDVKAMLDFCQMLYEPHDNGKIKLPLPKYWKMEMVGKGKLRFSRSTSIRTKIFEPWKPKVIVPLNRATALQAPAKNSLKLRLPGRQNSMSVRSPSVATGTPTPPPQPQPPQSQAAAPEGQRPTTKIKLKFGSRPSMSGQ